MNMTASRPRCVGHDFHSELHIHTTRAGLPTHEEKAARAPHADDHEVFRGRDWGFMPVWRVSPAHAREVGITRDFDKGAGSIL
jgi:hypothetical protein